MFLCSDRLAPISFCPLNKHGSVSYLGFATTKAETRAMATDQHTPAPTPTEEPFRYPRSQTVRILHACLDPDRPGPSARHAARTAGVPHTTLRYWQQRQRHTDAPPELVAFFESPAGLAFLKQLLLALHLVFQQHGTAGIRPLCLFLQLAQLAPFVASSYGAQQHLAAFLQALLPDYDQEQRQRLAPTMSPKDITLCEDENFHGDQPCLVAIEPLSNFLVLETYRPQRDAATWNSAVAAALEGLPVKVIQVTSDLAKGLQTHAKDGLAAQHSPDLMHVQADLHKATSLPLHRHLEAARQRLQQVQEEVQDWEERYQQHQAGIRSPGRAPDFAQHLGWAQQAEHYWEQQVSQRQERQEQVHEAVRGLGDDYHPFDAQTGQAVTAESMQQRLEQRVQTIERLAEQAAVSDVGREKLAKARRVLPRLVASLVWFWHSVRLLVESLELSEPAERAVYEQVLPGLYWAAAAERARTAQDKKRLRGLAAGCLEKAWSAEGVLSGLEEALQEVVKRVCAEGVSRFVRSSSCVEGRNGQLSLHHHGCHALSPRKLKALTVLHNYFIERADGSTAAERFFGQQPADLFTWLLERFPDPPRPAKRGRKPAKVAA
jgi:Family of unknown function (DUF6399)